MKPRSVEVVTTSTYLKESKTKVVFSDSPKTDAEDALVACMSDSGHDNAPDKDNDAPPKHAGFLLNLFASKELVDPTIDDLDDMYLKYYLPKYGPSRARLWYWKRVICSIAGFVLVKVKDLIEWTVNLRARLRS